MKYNFLRYPEGKTKAVTFSYDDGTVHDKRFSDTITPYGIKCTFNLCKGGWDKEDADKYMFSRGHEISIHGYNHRGMDTLRPTEMIQEVLNCKMALEENYGRLIRGYAYPDRAIRRDAHPDMYKTVRSIFEELDIAYCRTLGAPNEGFFLPQDWYNWLPTCHHGRALEYVDKFLEIDVSSLYIARREPLLFYMWGHSYEFNNNNNWEHLEKICEKLGNRDDIWYATNMEIYDYVTAYNSLKYSSNGKMVYNPTHITVWFDIDGKLYKIEPNQTITLE